MLARPVVMVMAVIGNTDWYARPTGNVQPSTFVFCLSAIPHWKQFVIHRLLWLSVRDISLLQLLFMTGTNGTCSISSQKFSARRSSKLWRPSTRTFLVLIFVWVKCKDGNVQLGSHRRSGGSRPGGTLIARMLFIFLWLFRFFFKFEYSPAMFVWGGEGK